VATKKGGGGLSLLPDLMFTLILIHGRKPLGRTSQGNFKEGAVATSSCFQKALSILRAAMSGAFQGTCNL